MPINAQVGDVIILTKPLGMQLVVNAHQWLHTKPERWEKVKHLVTAEEIEDAYTLGLLSMSRLNKTAATLMHKYGK